jgi:hypothetical protein
VKCRPHVFAYRNGDAELDIEINNASTWNEDALAELSGLIIMGDAGIVFDHHGTSKSPTLVAVTKRILGLGNCGRFSSCVRSA